MPLKQSFCIPCFAKHVDQWDGLLRAAATIGYAGVEIWGRNDHFEHLVALAKQHRMRVVSMVAHQSLSIGLNQISQHDRIEQEIKESIQLASAHDIPNLICFSGNRVEGQSDEESIESCVRGLKRVARYAESQKVTLNMELLNSKVDHQGYNNDHTTWGVDVCRRVASPNVKLLYDIYHMQIMEGDVIRTIREHIQWIGHFHTAGNPERHDLDDDQELNYRSICRAIRDAGYSLFVGHEFFPKHDPIDALKAAYWICHG